ncbi:hypothetical protein [Streptomyces liliifuscus]|uniref:Helix-turn-helix domain-containing protein n=1 Tax=Streptomyces liliifuscus TaxID=2797636 RepID=A0A7T7RFQ8_9ACTN|nr:hypothetical protein [Streptomyces liliifuscus]QQM44983.1 hypothetical protein JEQ17_40000 [Streptomyces liliifuscus]
MSDSQTDRASGSVPHTFRLRMAWQWVPRMPVALRRQKAFLYAVQTVAAMADTAGRTRWHAEDEDTAGRPLRLKELAAAMGSDEKDARRYLTAAIAAGILTTEQAPRRGRTTVYVLLLPPYTPRWEAAAAVLTAGGADTGEDDGHAPAGRAEFGGRSPVRDAPAAQASSGDASPNFPPVTGSQERGTPPRWSSGDGSPSRTGACPPNKPGSATDTHHEMVSVGTQVRDARGEENHERAEEGSPPDRPPSLRAVDGARPGAHDGSSRPTGQLPLLMSVPQPHGSQEFPAAPGVGDPPIGAPREGWRGRVARERPDDAAAVYGDRWTGDHARYLPHSTG